MDADASRIPADGAVSVRRKAAGFPSGEGRLDLVDRGHHGAPERGGRFVQRGFGQRNVAPQPRTLERRSKQVHR